MSPVEEAPAVLVAEIEALHMRLGPVEEKADGTQEVLLVRVTTDTGLVGHGEAVSNATVARSIVTAPRSAPFRHGLAVSLIGTDALQPEARWVDMYNARADTAEGGRDPCHGRRRHGPLGHSGAEPGTRVPRALGRAAPAHSPLCQATALRELLSVIPARAGLRGRGIVGLPWPPASAGVTMVCSAIPIRRSFSDRPLWHRIQPR